MEEYPIGDARDDEAGEILALQRLAYQTEAERYDDWSLPPLVQTLDELRGQLADHVFLVAKDANGRIVGSVRGRLEGGTCHVKRLAVHPDVRRRGIAARLMLELERRFPPFTSYELFTGHLSAPALSLYAALGYVEFRRERASDTTDLVYLRKLPTA